MFGIGKPLPCGASVLCCALLATSASAQGRPAVAVGGGRPGVQRMEIYNGATRTVRYFGDYLSPSESTLLREMERLENESAYVGDLQALKRQYVASEQLTELNRRVVQLSLYGRELTRSAYESMYAGYGYGYGYGYGGYRAAGYYGYPYAYSGVAVGGDSATEKYSLANGVGPQGAITDALAAVLAQQATPEYAASVERAYDRVAMLANNSPELRRAMRLPEYGRGRNVYAPTDRYTVTLKDGEKIYGKSVSVDKDDKDMYVIETAGDGKTRILKSEVKRIDDAGSGFKPVADR